MIYSKKPELMMSSSELEEDFYVESCTIQGGSISVQQIVAMYSRGEMVRPLQKPIDEGSDLRPVVTAGTKEEALQMSQQFVEHFENQINQAQQQAAVNSAPPASETAQNSTTATA